MHLSQLLSALPAIIARTTGDPIIGAITQNSRQAATGSLFVARCGGIVDGHEFIAPAVASGASAVVGETPPPDGLGVPYVQVPNSAEALAWLCAAFHQFPARQMVMIGVTGTDGKTTTSNLIHSILTAAGLKAGLISTVNAVIGDEVIDTGLHVTTPDAPDIQRYLARMTKAGMTHCVLESTSHGIAQHRITACEFDIAVVTNITHEHLDYHGSLDEYRAAKARLFEGLSAAFRKPMARKQAVLNADDWSFDYLRRRIDVPYVDYGFGESATMRAADINYSPQQTTFNVYSADLPNGLPFKTALVGEYNVANCLAAISVGLHALGLPGAAVQNGIAALRGVAGRMERINMGQDFTAIVDFAHTPNALRRAIDTARMMTAGKVIVVFGSAGLRDVAKRRWMGEIAAEHADYTIITAEDPRTESLDDILAESADGAMSKGGREGESFWRIPDRGDAISFAVRLAQSGDVVLACGKAHEQSMCFGTIEYPWDDRVAMRSALCARLGIEGEPMPLLPTSAGWHG